MLGIGAAVLAGIFFVVIILLQQDTHVTSTQLVFENATRVAVEIADSPAERVQGLQNREILPTNTGMLFVFDVADYYEFWMKNTRVNLDYVWMQTAPDGARIVDLTADVPAGWGLSETQVARVRPSTPADLVLEVPAGFIAVHALGLGDLVYFTLP